VLHLEPDVVEVLGQLAVQLRVVGGRPVAGDLLVLEQQFLGLVVERPRGDGAKSDGIKVDELVFTSERGRSVTSAGGASQPGAEGVVGLAVAVEKGTISGVGPDRGSTRMIVVGESIFLANKLF